MILQRLTAFSSLALVTAFACVLLAVLRMGAETSFHQPKHRPTSGLEEEALFSIWKVSQHQPVYADPFQIPYAISYFNWLFYSSYGLAGTLALNLLKIDSGWLPTMTRSLSLFLTLGCGVAFFQVAKEGRFWPANWSALEKVALCAIAVFNPLFGFFSFTTRPDAGALLFEMAGLALLLRYLRSQSRLTLVIATFALYCAWSFKQSAVVVVAGACLWFLGKRRFSDFFLVAGFSALLYLGTFLIGGPNYLYAVIKSQANCAFQFSLGLENFVRACLKSPFLPLTIGAILVEWFSRQRGSKSDEWGLLTALFAFSLIWCAVTSMKVGASDYYFLVPSSLAMLWLLGWCAPRENAALPKWILMTGLGLQLVGVVLVLAGKSGVISDPAEHERHRQLALKLDELPAPILVGERFGNLPWIQRKPPHFVYGYTYYFDRAAGRTYAHGGLAGLIRGHYFKTIVLRNSDSPPEQASFDDEALSDYHRLMSLAGYDFYALRQP